jgi:hypothetical protein
MIFHIIPYLITEGLCLIGIHWWVNVFANTRFRGFGHYECKNCKMSLIDGVPTRINER